MPELAVVVPTLNERQNISIFAKRLASALTSISWEAIFVDDDSNDGTIDEVRRIAQSDDRIRGIRRVSRRGLAGAVLEGMLSTSAQFIVVMDGDLQHDETRLGEMLSLLQKDEASVVIASRYCTNGVQPTGLSPTRQFGSLLATRLAQRLLKIDVSDPMSGFFMLRREVIDSVADKLSQQGFKILLDILASSPKPLRVREIPCSFRPRLYGETKLDSHVVLDYFGLLISKASGGILSIRILAFSLVGLSGVFVNLAVLAMLLTSRVGFAQAQTAAILAAMISNYCLNNALTYRDRRLHGWRFLIGLVSSAVLSSLGVLVAVGLSTELYVEGAAWWIAGIGSAAMVALWNYIASSAVIWR